ncbi:MAG: hypothetical protein F4X97_09790 [Boseongicola sp. SB0662_bin_57]|nr:hypothetical protein [Boseongicola sp. SB0662_bin_57]
MHVDIHYYGTYAMARVAGLKRDVCQTIASAAQFVDANDKDYEVDLRDGGRLNVIPTAHPLTDIKNTALFERDQRRVWVPFHFLPGNEGNSMSERLICRKDSDIAQEMVDHCLSLVDEPFGLYIVGIAAHVYADTFSHYGFSGVSSRWNQVKGDSIDLLNDERDEGAERHFWSKYNRIFPNWRTFLDGIKSGVAEEATGALGHGAALKYPDFPYLQWRFSYEHSEHDPGTSERNNAETFLEACEKLYERFRSFGEDYRDPEIDQDGNFDKIRGVVKDILETKETDRERRGEIWSTAAEDGHLFPEPEEILPYQGEKWKTSLENLDGNEDSHAALEEPVFQFFRAAAIYRTYVLRHLLPAHELVLD